MNPVANIQHSTFCILHFAFYIQHSKNSSIHIPSQFLMNLSIGGEDMRLVGRIFFSFEIGDRATGFQYDQRTCCTIPCLQLMFIEAIEPSGSHPAQIYSGAPQPAYRDSLPDEFFKNLQRAIW